MKVKVYASTSNLGPGFDTLGAALNIYNEYEFDKSDNYELVNFDERYNKAENNLIIQSYERLFNKYNKNIIPIKLIQKEANIPTSRGLGSSAACIAAGLLMANYMLGNTASEDELFQIASSIEGHPDNSAPVILGGFTSSFKENDKYYTTKLSVSDNLVFTVVIPNFELATSVSRSVIKKEVSLSDATYNVSHAIATIKAIEEGNIDKLKIAMKDKLHEPYRLSLIKDSNKVKQLASDNNAVCVISGAGSTMLVISSSSIENILKDNLDKDWIIKEVKVVKDKSFVY